MGDSLNCGLSGAGLACVLLFAGCATSHTFKVDAISNPEVESGDAFHIVTGNPRVSEEDPQFQEMAGYVKTALARRGYHQAAGAEDADIVIEVVYGTNQPQIDFKTVSSNASDVVIDQRTGQVYTGPGAATRARVLGGGGGPITIDRDDTEYIPVTTYEKYLKLVAWENREGVEPEKQTQVWQVTVKTKDDKDDMQRYLPLLAAASIEFVGEDTENQEKIVLRENDDEVVSVKAGM